MLNVGCYYNLLTNILDYNIYYVDKNLTVKELVKKYPTKKLIIRVQGHLTSSIFGTLLDIWNCENELVDCFWIVD